jgi:hypothetical protein
MTRSAAPWLWTPLVLVSLFLAVLIVRDGLANWAVENRRGHALDLAPDDPRALAGAADDALAGLKSPADAPHVEDLARCALLKGPTQVDALRDLGLAADLRGDKARAHDLIDLAARRSPLDAPSHLWRLKERLLAGDNAGALEDADDLLRHDPDRLAALMPALLYAARSGPGPLIARLETNPPWRHDFLIRLATDSSAPALQAAIMQALVQSRDAPREDEVGAYLNHRVMVDHAYQGAYLDWLQLLPPAALAKAALVYDGAFEGLPGAKPFNWALASGVGGEAEIAPAPAGATGHALDVHYDGYANFALATQLLALAPGAYHLTGLTHTSGDAAGALAWTVACAEGPPLTPTPTSTPVAPDGWRAFEIAFTVPASGCEGQWMNLTPQPGGHERTMEVWYRALAIRRG